MTTSLPAKRNAEDLLAPARARLAHFKLGSQSRTRAVYDVSALDSSPPIIASQTSAEHASPEFENEHLFMDLANTMRSDIVADVEGTCANLQSPITFSGKHIEKGSIEPTMYTKKVQQVQQTEGWVKIDGTKLNIACDPSLAAEWDLRAVSMDFYGEGGFEDTSVSPLVPVTSDPHSSINWPSLPQSTDETACYLVQGQHGGFSAASRSKPNPGAITPVRNHISPPVTSGLITVSSSSPSSQIKMPITYTGFDAYKRTKYWTPPSSTVSQERTKGYNPYLPAETTPHRISSRYLSPPQFRIGELLALLRPSVGSQKAVIEFHAVLNKADRFTTLLTFSDIYTPEKGPYVIGEYYPMGAVEQRLVGKMVRVIAQCRSPVTTNSPPKGKDGQVLLIVARIEEGNWDYIDLLSSLT